MTTLLFEIAFTVSNDDSFNTKLEVLKLNNHTYGFLYIIVSNKGWNEFATHASKKKAGESF